MNFSKLGNLEKLEIVGCDFDEPLTFTGFENLEHLLELHICGGYWTFTNENNIFKGLRSLTSFEFWSSFDDNDFEFDVNVLSGLPEPKNSNNSHSTYRLKDLVDIDFVKSLFPNLHLFRFLKID